MAEPRDYLKDYLGINPLDYSAIESQIAGQSPFASETASIIPTVSNLPKPRLLSDMDFQDLTAPLMQRVYGRAEDARLRADDLASQLQALEAEKAQLAETETTRRAELEQQIQNLTQQRVEAEQQARSLQQQIETQAGDISGLEQQLSERTGRIGSLEELLGKRDEMLRQSEISLEEITQARDEFRRDAEQSRQQQDFIRQQASEEQARSLEEQRQQLLAEREQIVGGLQGQIEEGQMVLAETESKLQEITALRDQALADAEQARLEQDVIRQQASENLARSLEEQRQGLLSERESIIQSLEAEFGVERGQLEGRIGELESIKTGLESDINDLSSQISNLESEKQDAIAQQDVIRAEAAQQQQDALAQQASQFDVERSQLQQQIDDLSAQVGQAPTGGVVEEPSVISDQPETPFDQYLRDQERIDAAVGMMPGGDAIQKGIEELYGRVTAGGGKPEDFTIYKPPADMPTPSAPSTDAGLPEGYSYEAPSGRMYTTVMPRQGYRYAYGPNGERIEVPDTRTPTSTPPTISKPLPDLTMGEKIPLAPPSTPRPSPLVSQPPKPSLEEILSLSPSNFAAVDPPRPQMSTRPSPLSNLGSTSIANDGTLGDAPLGLEDLLFQPPARPIDFMPDPRLKLSGVPPKPIPRPVSPLVSQPPRPLPSKPVGGVELPRSQQGVGNILLPPIKPTNPSPAFPSRTPLASMRPPMQFAGGGSLDQALYDLRSRLSK